MLTTCPEGATTFRVTQEQLGARRGMVRCGRCNAVFNAYDNLRTEIEEPSLGEMRETRADEVSGYGEPEPSHAEAEVRFAGQDDWPDQAVRAESMADDDTGFHAPEYMAEPAEEPDAGTRGDEESVVTPPSWYENLGEEAVELRSDEASDRPDITPRKEIDDILLSALPGHEEKAPGGLTGRMFLRGLLAVALLLVMVAQAVFFLRAELVEQVPELRQPMTEACKALGCTLPPSRDLAALRIEASSLETDPEQSAHARLRVTFSNRSTQAQSWPYFVLKLSDVRNTPMAQKVFKPADYLGKNASPSKGIQARSEHEFQLDLDLGTLSAAGYEVKPYYP